MNGTDRKEKEIADLTNRVAMLEELLKSRNIVSNNIGYVHNNNGTSYTQININVSQGAQLNNFGEEDVRQRHRFAEGCCGICSAQRYHKRS